MVEHNLAKVGVASSSLVSRSNTKKRNRYRLRFFLPEIQLKPTWRGWGDLLMHAKGFGALFFVVKWAPFVVGFKACFVQLLIDVNFVVRHEMQAVAAQKP